MCKALEINLDTLIVLGEGLLFLICIASGSVALAYIIMRAVEKSLDKE